jgi:hypothetical protein
MGNDVVAETHVTPSLVLIYLLMLILMGIAWRRPGAAVTFNWVIYMLAQSGASTDVEKNGASAGVKEGSARDADQEQPR